MREDAHTLRERMSDQLHVRELEENVKKLEKGIYNFSHISHALLMS